MIVTVIDGQNGLEILVKEGETELRASTTVPQLVKLRREIDPILDGHALAAAKLSGPDSPISK